MLNLVMYILDEQKKEKILKIVKLYSEKWIEDRERTLFDTVQMPNHSSNEKSWNCPENIESGLSGVAIFFIDTYHKTNDGRYLEIAKNIVAEMILHCKNHSTDNYSLFTGRCGVVYAILQLYPVTKDIYLLSEAVDILLLAKEKYLFSEYVNDSLYEGRSGTLLILFGAYEIIQESALLDDIHLFLRKIIGNIKLGEAGIYWENYQELHSKPLVGLARGTSGIRYVLNRIKAILLPDVLFHLNTHLQSYEDSCWCKEFGNWANFAMDIQSKNAFEGYKKAYLENQNFSQKKNDYSWSEGTAGLGLFKLYMQDEVRGISNIVYDGIASKDIGDYSLYSGLAGIGYFLSEASNKLYEVKYHKMALDIGDKILSNLSNKKNFNHNFFHGDLGQLYFLLSLIGADDQQETPLFPLSQSFDKNVSDLKPIEISDTMMRQEQLKNILPRTWEMLNVFLPHSLQHLLSNTTLSLNKSGIDMVFDYFETLVMHLDQTPIGKPLRDLLTFEKNKYDFVTNQGKNKGQIYLAAFIHYEKMSNLFNRLDNKLFDTAIKQSSNVRTICTKWNWCEKNELMYKIDIIENFCVPPANVMTVMNITEHGEITEKVLDDVEPFCWLWFSNKSTIRLMIKGLTQYCDQLSKIELEEKIKSFGSKDESDFRNTLTHLHVTKIKEWLYERMLIADF